MPIRKFGKGKAQPTSRKIVPFDWGQYLDNTHSDAVPVHNFKHCVSSGWLGLVIGMKVEVLLPRHECSTNDSLYWIATVIKIAGYKTKLRYEGCESDGSLDFWFNLSSPDIHHIGWCASCNRKLFPPKSVSKKKVEWREYLLKRIIGSPTLPADFYNQFIGNVGNHKFCNGMVLEVMDKACIAANRVARVIEVVDSRLHLQYEGTSVNNNDIWCHKDSNLIHPVGWSFAVGHRLYASPEYMEKSREMYMRNSYETDYCQPDMFRSYDNNAIESSGFEVGMKLEAIDPLNLATICVATVMKVLKNGFLMIGIDGYMDEENGNDWFCYHSSSASILPAGFCDINDLEISPPKGYESKFSWSNYLLSTKSHAAPVKLFNLRLPELFFKEGQKLEAVDLMDPRLICVATIKKVVGRLLKIRFDGWEEAFDQWVDCESPDIYPVGWCEVMKYNLESPKEPALENKVTKSK